MMNDFLEKVSRFTAEKELFSTPCHILLGLSGGADSMALLYTLLHWPQPGVSVSAIHVHHGLRGAEADRDEAFVREQCAKWQVPLEVVHADVADTAAKVGCGVEEAGRKVRYATFDAVADRLGCDHIATAHNADDQAETVLMHIIRGCGVDGLTGIPAKRERIVRPLLCCTRAEIEALCAHASIPFVLDSTNTDTAYTRNLVRQELLPRLRQLNPGVGTALLRLAEHAAADSACLTDMARARLSPAPGSGYWVADFAQQPVAVRRRMITQVLRESGHFTIEEKHILQADQAILSGGGAVTLPGGDRLTVTDGRVYVSAPTDKTAPVPAAICLAGQDMPVTFAFDGVTYRLTLLDAQEATRLRNVHKMFFKFTIDYARIQGDLHVRPRKTGERFHPSGRYVGKTVKKLMNEWHIPTAQRDRLPLLCDEVGVLLVPGYACDQRVRPDEKTKLFLVWETLSETG